MPSKSENTKYFPVTVFIPTFNCDKEIFSLIEKIKDQNYKGKVEILVIDSSTDEKSRELVRELKEVRLIEIDNKDFGHGKTRNKAMEEAKGEIVVFLTQDAIPFDESWLEEIVSPFTTAGDILCVFGNQIPYNNCNPFMEYKITSTFKNISKSEIVLHSKEEKDKPGTYFNSNVNAAYRKSAFPGKIKFADVDYAEDQDIAEQIIDKGYKKAYNPNAKVYHSHSWNDPWEYFQRYFDEYRGLKKAIGYEDKSLWFFKIYSRAFKSWMVDVKNILFNSKAGIFSKLLWCFHSIGIEIYRYSAMYLGPRFEKIPQSIQNLWSREDMQRNLKVNKLGFFAKLKASYLVHIYVQFGQIY